MKTLLTVAIAAVVLAGSAGQPMAGTTTGSSREPVGSGERDRVERQRIDRPEDRSTAESGPQTGGDTRPNAVDPAQAETTGANAGEGASYSRSNEKGESTLR